MTDSVDREKYGVFHAIAFMVLLGVVGGIALVKVHAVPVDNLSAVIRGKVTKHFETHYNKAVPVHDFGVSLWAAIDYGVFDEGRKGVIVGNDGWLYSDEEFAVGNDAHEIEARNLKLTRWIVDQYRQHGARVLIAVVPEKARVYPEHLGDNRQPDVQRQLHHTLIAALRQRGLDVVDLLPALRDGKAHAATFLRTDSHWTPYGAGLAANSIAAQVRSQSLVATGAQQFKTVREAQMTRRGDLFNFLPLRPYFGWMLPPPDHLYKLHTVALKSDSGSSGLFGDSPAPQVALVGTSYSAIRLWDFQGALEQALGTEVANYAKDGRGPFVPALNYLNSADIKNDPPKLVIWEFPERYLPVAFSLTHYHLPADVQPASGNRTVAEQARSGSG